MALLMDSRYSDRQNTMEAGKLRLTRPIATTRRQTKRSELLSQPFVFHISVVPARCIRSAVYTNRRQAAKIVDVKSDKQQSTQRIPMMPELPAELVLQILDYLDDWQEVWRMRGVSRSFMTLCLSHPTAYNQISLDGFLPESGRLGIQDLPPSIVNFVLPAARTLALTRRKQKCERSIGLLGTVSWRHLSKLDLSFNASATDADIAALFINGVRLTELRLRACRSIRDGQFLARNTPTVQTLDLSWSGVRNMPRAVEAPLPLLLSAGMELDDWADATLVDEEVDAGENAIWPVLRELNLSFCESLEAGSLGDFLTLPHVFPPALQQINLSQLRHYQIPLHICAGLSVTVAQSNQLGKSHQPNSLQTVILKGVDHLTLVDVQYLETHWLEQRNGDTNNALKIEHDILLEAPTLLGYTRLVAFLGGLPRQ